MIAAFFMGLALVIGVILLGRWYVSNSPKDVLRTLGWVALGVVLCVILFLALSGKLGLAIAAMAGLLPWARRLWSVFGFVSQARQFGRAAGFGGSQAPPDSMGDMGAGAHPGNSTVETDHLRMELNHATGGMTGVVRTGLYAGASLHDLDPQEMGGLIHALRNDEESLRLLEAWLDRERPDWREHVPGADGMGSAGGGSGPGRQDQHNESPRARPSTAMDRAEALAVLGLEDDEGDDPDAVKSAHRRLMAIMHPDKGGSDHLAAKINQARSVLLGE